MASANALLAAWEAYDEKFVARVNEFRSGRFGSAEADAMETESQRFAAAAGVPCSAMRELMVEARRSGLSRADALRQAVARLEPPL